MLRILAGWEARNCAFTVLWQAPHVACADSLQFMGLLRVGGPLGEGPCVVSGAWSTVAPSFRRRVPARALRMWDHFIRRLLGGTGRRDFEWP